MNYDLKTVTRLLVLIGALNWGLIAVNKEWNLVKLVGDVVQKGSGPSECRTFDRAVYFAVGASAVYMLMYTKKGKQ